MNSNEIKEKAREFWFTDQISRCYGEVYDQYRKDAWQNDEYFKNYIHVIEYSACKSLINQIQVRDKEIEVLKAQLKILKNIDVFCAENIIIITFNGKQYIIGEGETFRISDYTFIEALEQK